MNRKLVGLFAVILAFVYLSNPVLAASEYTENVYCVNENQAITDLVVENQNNAITTYSQWFKTIKENKSVVAINESDENEFSYSVQGLYAEDYPEYYAGAYINMYGNLVMMYTED